MKSIIFLLTCYKIIISLLFAVILFNVLVQITDKMYAYPDVYCRVNAEFYEYNTCTKMVALAGFSIAILPIFTGLGTYLILSKVQKKAEVLFVD